MVSKQARQVLIEVTSRHQPISERTRAFANERAEKLSRYNDRLSRVQVIMDEAHEEFEVELVAHVDSGKTIVCKEAGDGYRSAMDAALMRMERQLKKEKEKRCNHKHDGLKDQTDAVVNQEEAEEATYDQALRDSLDS